MHFRFTNISNFDSKQINTNLSFAKMDPVRANGEVLSTYEAAIVKYQI